MPDFSDLFQHHNSLPVISEFKIFIFNRSNITPAITLMIIIDFEDKYAAAFKQLNLEWLQQYQLTEAHDLEILNNPEGTIIAPGGCIFLAMEDGVVAGCAGLMKVTDDEYELVKMTVAPAFQGRGFSKLLLAQCLEAAKQRGAKTISLLSNHQLETAIHLYKRFGFIHVPVGKSHFELADVKMILQIPAE
ncbi:MAG: GNAT family N-acetyltransferase [Chitinophagaceae bacterium]